MQGDPFRRTLTRSTIAALALAVLLLAILPRHASLASDFVDVFTVAFCFTFLGHYIEGFLRSLPGIEKGAGQLVHLAAWFAGGVWCYVVGRWLWIKYGRDLNDLPGLMAGGVFMVMLQLFMQAIGSRSQGAGPQYSRQTPRRKHH